MCVCLCVCVCVCVCETTLLPIACDNLSFLFVIKVQGHLYCALFTGFVWGSRGCTDVIALLKKNIKAHWFAVCMESHIKAPLLMLNSRRTSLWWKWWKHRIMCSERQLAQLIYLKKINVFLPFTSRPMSNKQPSQPFWTPAPLPPMNTLILTYNVASNSASVQGQRV